ncbi:MAG: galactokinase, partial [Burkholderiaceae bacterium]
TDYNDGYVLPIAIPQRTRVAVRRSATNVCTVHAANLNRTVTFEFESPPPDGFATYVYGCVFEARAAGFDVPPLDIHLSSNVPMGVGLSSSAALEVATLRALRNLLSLPLDDVRLAQVAQRAEVQHAGVRCGIMDQMAASLADTEQALFLDTRTLHSRLIPLPPMSAVLVLDSGIKRSLATSSFNQRRAECEEAARQLGVQALRDVDVDELAKIDALDEPWRGRARHVVTENARVLKALQCDGAVEFGALMNASHASLRDDFDVSVPALDRLVNILQAHPDVYGSRLTGAGFGGACVALCESSALARISAQVLSAYERDGFRGELLVPPIQHA